jgi:hypothetical protein
MPEYTIEAKIAAGHDNVGSLALITALSASSIPFIEVRTRASYFRGQKRFKANGTTGFAGFNGKRWTSSLLWLPQWELLASTYQGAVTIHTWLGGVTYANYNALLDFDEEDAFEAVNTVEYGWALVDFVWKFTDLTLIPDP